MLGQYQWDVGREHVPAHLQESLSWNTQWRWAWTACRANSVFPRLPKLRLLMLLHKSGAMRTGAVKKHLAWAVVWQSHAPRKRLPVPRIGWL